MELEKAGISDDATQRSALSHLVFPVVLCPGDAQAAPRIVRRIASVRHETGAERQQRAGVQRLPGLETQHEGAAGGRRRGHAHRDAGGRVYVVERAVVQSQNLQRRNRKCIRDEAESPVRDFVLVESMLTCNR